MSTTAPTAAPTVDSLGDGGRSTMEKRRNAIRGAFLSEFIDMFDIYLPVVALAPVMFIFRPAHLSAATDAIMSSVVFITTLLGRPVGALIFGMVADRIGRRAASIYSVSGFGVVTAFIALLPGYQTVGIASYIMLVLLRFVDGIFLGGGYTGALPLAIEYSPREKRGFVGGLILAAFPCAYLSINLITMLMFFLFPLHGAGSPYTVWGWRIPFVVGAILAVVLVVYYVRKVSESEVWEEKEAEIHEKAPKLPLRSLLSGQSGRNLMQVLVLMTGFWLTQNLITIFLPTGLLVHTLHMSGTKLTAMLMITYGVLFFSYIGSGMLSQVTGRRMFFAIAGPLIATVGAILFYVLGHTPDLGFGPRTALLCVLAVLVTSPWGVILTYINERFVTEVRATGFGVGFSLSVVIPSFYAFYMAGLGSFMPLSLTPIVLLIVGGLIGMTGALMGPETRHVDFSAER